MLLLTAAGLSFFAGSNEEAPALTENQTEVQDSQETAVSENMGARGRSSRAAGHRKDNGEGSRVIEAIEAAGGLLPEADSTNLNFAAQAPLEDKRRVCR